MDHRQRLPGVDRRLRHRVGAIEGEELVGDGSGAVEGSGEGKP